MYFCDLQKRGLTTVNVPIVWESCDHVAKHIESQGKWQLQDYVHIRDTLGYYKSQYPDSLPEYPSTNFNKLRGHENIFLPVVSSKRRGRPKRNRFISRREKAITRAKNSMKRKKSGRQISLPQPSQVNELN